MACRSPHGLRGLKFDHYIKEKLYIKSQPAWAAWIEISYEPETIAAHHEVAARMGCVD